MARNTSVMGIYPNRATVSEALNTLNKAGYRPADISVLSSDNVGSKDFAHVRQNKALQGAAIGSGNRRGGWRCIGLAGIYSTGDGHGLSAARVCRCGPGCYCRGGRRRNIGLDRRLAGGPAF